MAIDILTLQLPSANASVTCKEYFPMASLAHRSWHQLTWFTSNCPALAQTQELATGLNRLVTSHPPAARDIQMS